MSQSQLTPEEESTLKTYNDLAKLWVAKITMNFYAKELKTFHELLPAGKVLEIGSGSGRDAAELIKIGYEYLGTDISEKLLIEARRNNPGADFRQVNLYELDFKEKFDGFWCAAVLLHIPKKRIDEALQAITRNLKPGAIGFITVKEGKGDGLQLRSEKDRRFFAYWQSEEFEKVLKANGLEVIKKGRRDMKEEPAWLAYFVEKTH